MVAHEARVEPVLHLDDWVEESSPSVGPELELLSTYLARGGRQDFARLHRYLAPSVHAGAARALVLDPRRRGRSHLPDLMQEAWLHLLANNAQALRSFDVSRGHLRTYVARVAFNRALDRLRLRNVGDVGAETLEPLETVRALEVRDPIEARDGLQGLTQYLRNTLPSGVARVFDAVFVKDHDTAEAAHQLGFTRPYILKCKNEIRKAARSWRGRHYGDD